MHDIFLSYAKEDKNFVILLSNALKKEGFDVWWDIEIPTGKTFNSVIENAIENSKCVIVLWSKQSITSEWVHEEASEGKKRNILIPLRIEDVEIPLGFRIRQTADLIDWNKNSSDPSFQRILEDIRLVINKSEASNESKRNSKIASRGKATDQKLRKTTSPISKFLKSKKLWFLVLFFVLIALLIGYKSDFFNNDNNIPSSLKCPQKISGIVTDNIGVNSKINRNAGVIIQLLNDAGESLDSYTVDESGYYEFNVECQQKYALIASKTAYRRIMEDVQASDNKVLVLDLVLPKLECEIDFADLSVFFDFDKYSIRPDAAVELEPLISILMTYPDLKINIEAHTDNRIYGDLLDEPHTPISSAQYKQKFSEMQAKSIAAYILSNGVKQDQIVSVKGYGTSQLIISDEEISSLPESQRIEAHQKNRRAKITLIGCGN
jgi:outer membrane protein OmpA-like peptidoglycan-associated protein